MSSKTEDTILAVLMLMVIVLIIVAIPMIIFGVKQAVVSSGDAREFKGKCDYLHGHVAELDYDHSVCISDGKVVLKNG